MNEAMAASWRAVVRPDDEIIVVGDFAHRADPAELRNLFDSLPGRKHLVAGNHDGEATKGLGWESDGRWLGKLFCRSSLRDSGRVRRS